LTCALQAFTSSEAQKMFLSLSTPPHPPFLSLMFSHIFSHRHTNTFSLCFSRSDSLSFFRTQTHAHTHTQYAACLALALHARTAAESHVRFNLCVDNMPIDDLPPFPPAQEVCICKLMHAHAHSCVCHDSFIWMRHIHRGARTHSRG